MVQEDHSLREALDHLLSEGVGRLLVVSPDRPRRLVGILTRSDILAEFDRHQAERVQEPPILRFGVGR